jgi:hypothetical protein
MGLNLNRSSIPAAVALIFRTVAPAAGQPCTSFAVGIFPQKNQHEDYENDAAKTDCDDKFQHPTLLIFCKIVDRA